MEDQLNMKTTAHQRAVQPILAAMAAAAIVFSMWAPKSSAATVTDAGPFPFSGCTVGGAELPPPFGEGTFSFSGTFPDTVEPGQTFTVSDAEIVVEMENPVNHGPLHDDQGPVLEFGDWGTVTFPAPIVDAGSQSIRDGVQTAQLDSFTLTAPDGEGVVEVAATGLQYRDGSGTALPPFDCELDPEESVVTTLTLLAPTTTTVPDDGTPTTTVPDDGTPTTVPGDGNGDGDGGSSVNKGGGSSTAPAASPVSGSPSYTG